MKIIVGLGNPGPRYRNTRHNVGFMTLDGLADHFDVRFSREKYHALIAKTEFLHHEPVLLMKPLTYMNRSGESVARAVRYSRLDPADLIVVVDDVHLPLGKLRLRDHGSAGGHNGLQSVIDCLGAEDFPRLRIGVGMSEAAGGLVTHVLGKFAPDEKQEVKTMVARAAEAVLCVLACGVHRAMNQFN